MSVVFAFFEHPTMPRVSANAALAARTIVILRVVLIGVRLLLSVGW
jgi:hypothetical protein